MTPAISDRDSLNRVYAVTRRVESQGLPQGITGSAPPRTREETVPPFWAYVTTDDDDDPAIKVTGGRIFIGAGLTLGADSSRAAIHVADSDYLYPANGDTLWVYPTAANVWGFATGAPGAYPTKFFRPLVVQIVVDGETGAISFVDSKREWWGGDMHLTDSFAVTLAVDGGAAGSASAECSYTYTATTLAGVQIGTGMTPHNSRARITNSPVITTASKGSVRILANGTYELWDANERLDQSICVPPE